MVTAKEELQSWLRPLGQESIADALLTLVDRVSELRDLQPADLSRLQIPEHIAQQILKKADARCLKRQPSVRAHTQQRAPAQANAIDWSQPREGILEKKGQDKSVFGVTLSGSYQRRLFSLSRGVFSYSSEDGFELKKRYRWFDCSHNGQADSASTELVFRVEVKEQVGDKESKVMSLKAATQREMDCWIQALGAHKQWWANKTAARDLGVNLAASGTAPTVPSATMAQAAARDKPRSHNAPMLQREPTHLPQLGNASQLQDARTALKLQRVEEFKQVLRLGTHSLATQTSRSSVQSTHWPAEQKSVQHSHPYSTQARVPPVLDWGKLMDAASTPGGKTILQQMRPQPSPANNLQMFPGHSYLQSQSQPSLAALSELESPEGVATQSQHYQATAGAKMPKKGRSSPARSSRPATPRTNSPRRSPGAKRQQDEGWSVGGLVNWAGDVASSVVARVSPRS